MKMLSTAHWNRTIENNRIRDIGTERKSFSWLRLHRSPAHGSLYEKGW
ncbi:hypothetical protein ASZ90_011293 [hydrocarbon metagenome]|uniref:Uncharacterized protein n=1 Tax=hydrocarbon metagenome TaxID=938273 RepID=A0A0W8FDS9_9ZZZZ